MLRFCEMKVDLLKNLSELPGISGYEDDVREFIIKQIKGKAKIEVDALGNVIAKVVGREKGPTVMLAAHMDEVGFVVKYIEKEGVLRFVKIGGIDNRILLDQRVVVWTKKGPLHGMIESRPPHIQKKEEQGKIMKHDELFIDIGAKDSKEVERFGIQKGDAVTFDSSFVNLTDKTCMGKAFDNRIGIYLLIEAINNFKPKKGIFYFVFSTQEETGLKGARTAAFKLDPDFAIAIDTTIAGGIPAVKPQETDLLFGKGPIITFLEAGGRGAMVPQSMRQFLIGLAKKAKIDYQTDIIEGGMTDAAMIQLTREGILTGGVSVPVRNIHAANSICYKKDIDITLKFIGEIIKNCDKLKK
jgi:putative aminopeptidase FrvX